MNDSMKREGARLSTRLEMYGISFDDLQKSTGKRPHYLERVLKGIYPITRPVCEAVDKLAGLDEGTTFAHCVGGESE